MKMNQKSTADHIKLRPLGLDGVFEIVPSRHYDARGFVSETWKRSTLQNVGINLDFVQDNHSLSSDPGTLRGLHYQLPPKAQDKLVRVVYGAIFDVIVDIRVGSPDYGRWVGLELSAQKWNQVLIPQGYAHGFVTLAPNTEVVYKVTDDYSPSHVRSIRFNDPDIGIEWPTALAPFHLSDRDRNAPMLADVNTGFRY